MRLVRTWVRNEQASLRRPLAHEVVGIWRSEYFVGTSVHQNKALLKKNKKLILPQGGLHVSFSVLMLNQDFIQ